MAKISVRVMAAPYGSSWPDDASGPSFLDIVRRHGKSGVEFAVRGGGGGGS